MVTGRGPRVVLLGKQGAGKGTQAARVAEHYAVVHLATGDIFRAAARDETELGIEARKFIDRGELVPDGIVIGVVREHLMADDGALVRDGFVLDGFPRTLPQAEALDAILAESDRELSVILDFHLSEELAEQRLLKRALEQRREDDTPEVIHRRMETMRVPDALVEYYRARGILVGIHAERSIDEVFAEVQSVLQAAAAR